MVDVSTTQRVHATTHLQQVLVDLIDLTLQVKHVHWNVHGHRFRALHLQFDEIAETARTYADAVAERVVAMGTAPDGRTAEVHASSCLHADRPGPGPIDDDEAARVVEAMLTQVIHGLAEAIGLTDEHDPVSQGLLVEASASLEKQRWMLAASG